MEVLVEKLVPTGLGLARSEEGAIFVPGGLPGERVRGRLVRKRGAWFLEEVEVLSPSPFRYPHPLPPSADLPLVYEAQLPIKEGFVRESLERLARLEARETLLHPIRPSPRPLAYRAAAQYALHPLGGLAYRRPGSYILERLSEDPLLIEPLQEAFRLLSFWPLGVEEVALRGSLHEGKALLGLIGGDPRALRRTAQALVREGLAGVVWAEPHPKGRFRGRVMPLAGRRELLEAFGGVLASVSVQSFAQVNPLAAGALFQEAQALAGEGKRALELYAGSGVLSLLLSQAFQEMVALEINKDAIRRGEKDKARLKVENLRFHRGDVREAAQFGAFDLVAVDPPRSGLSREVLGYLYSTRPKRILYIACDPATWARDVGRLLKEGYRLRFIRPYDFFPFTHHLEVLSLLEA